MGREGPVDDDVHGAMCMSAMQQLPDPGWAVIGANGVRLGMVSGFAPTAEAPSELLVFYADRAQLIPREFRLPMSSVTGIDQREVHVAVTADAVWHLEHQDGEFGDGDDS